MPKKNLAFLSQKIEPSILTHPSFSVILRKVECLKKSWFPLPTKLLKNYDELKLVFLQSDKS